MRFVAKLRVVDTRPEKPEGTKKDPPEGGWRNVSGVTKISPDLRVEADDFAGALKTVSDVAAKYATKDDAGEIVDIKIERETPPESTTKAWGL